MTELVKVSDLMYITNISKADENFLECQRRLIDIMAFSPIQPTKLQKETNDYMNCTLSSYLIEKVLNKFILSPFCCVQSKSTDHLDQIGHENY